MKNKRLHTPEGVRDLYNEECEKKHYILSKMRDVIDSYGYRFIETPTFEFFDIFGNEVGTTPSKDLYKFFDREGNTLVLRPDMTPSIARAASKYFPVETQPIRLCYEGNVFINNNSYQGRLKESTQLGVEFIGENSLDADAEIIALVVNNLKAAGLEQFQISLGHANLFRSLCQAAAFSEDDEALLRDLILNKNFFGMDDFLSKNKVDSDLKKLFSMLGQMYSSPLEWEDMYDLAKKYPEVYTTLIYLRDLYEILLVYNVTNYTSFELGIVSSYQYYTGLLFSGYTFGSGEPIVKGGRYDNLLSYYGKNAPAIGFALMVDRLLQALNRQKIELPIDKTREILLYRKGKRKEAIELARSLRAEKKSVQMILMDSKNMTTDDYKKLYGDGNITVLEEE